MVYASRSLVLVYGAAAVLAVVTGMYLIDDAEASHFRAGSLHTDSTAAVSMNSQGIVGLPVTLHGEMVWRASAFQNVSVGDCVPGEGPIQWGDGLATSAWSLLVAQTRPATDNVMMRVMDLGCEEALEHLYPPTAGQVTYEISWTSCCRMHQGHQNHPNGQIRLMTTAQPAVSNHAPSAEAFLARYMGTQPCSVTHSLCFASLGVNDPDAGTMRTFRFATPCEASPTCAFQPLSSLGAFIHSNGTLEWDAAAHQVGLYSVQVMVGDGQTEVPVDFMLDVFTTNARPVPNFTWDGKVIAGEPETFTSTASDPDGQVVDWYWLASGQPKRGQGTTFTTTFASSGWHAVTHAADDDEGASHELTQWIWVAAPPPNQAPTAALTGNGTGTTWNFSDASSDTDGTISAWYWDFGDGTNSTVQHPTHRFAPGSYTVRLTVWDDDGASATVTKTVTAPCQQACSV